MRFKALNRPNPDNEVLSYFGLEDSPVHLWDNTCALISKNNSNTFRADTVMRGTDDGTIWEGDYVYSKDTDEYLGLVVFNEGWKVVNYPGFIQRTLDMDHMYLQKGNRKSIQNVSGIKERTPIVFIYEGYYFSFKNIIKCIDGVLEITVIGNRLSIPLDKIKPVYYQDREGNYYTEDDYQF